MSLHMDDDENNSRRDRRRRQEALRAKRYRRRLKRKQRDALRDAKQYEIGEDWISDYDTFVAYMVARRKALGLTQDDLDDLAGFTHSHTSKLEAWRGPQGRVASSVTMPRWFAALGVELKPVVKPPVKVPGPRLNGAQLARRVPE